jgi:putative membrane protein
MGSSYLWVKAFHIVFVASWFAGLFYLPRIFVNLAMVAPDSHAERERLLLMARKLYRFANILMVVALVLGFVLWLGYGVGMGRAGLDARQAGAGGRRDRLPAHVPPPAARLRAVANRRSHKWYRVFNEVTVLLFIAIVVLVVVKPF